MTDGQGRGWYGDPEGHREAVKKSQRSRAGQVLVQLKRVGMLLLLLPVRGIRFLGQQARGTWSNLGRGWDYLTFDNMLPPSIVGTIQWFIETIPKLLGIRGTKPWQQVGAALSLIGFALLATAEALRIGELGLLGIAGIVFGGPIFSVAFGGSIALVLKVRVAKRGGNGSRRSRVEE